MCATPSVAALACAQFACLPSDPQGTRTAHQTGIVSLQGVREFVCLSSQLLLLFLNKFQNLASLIPLTSIFAQN